MASPLRTAFPTKEEYEKQVASYDAGRPNTAAVQKRAAGFQPAESSGMSMPEPSRQQIAQVGPPPRWSMGEIVKGVSDEWSKDRARRVGQAMAIGGRVVGALKDFGEGMTEGRFIGQNPNTASRPAMAMSTGTEQSATPARQPIPPSGAGPRWSVGEVARDVAKEYGLDRDSRAAVATSIASGIVDSLGRFGEDMTEGRFLGRGGAGASPQAGGATARPAMALRAAPDSALPETRAAAAMTPIKMLSTDAASSGVDMRNMPSSEQIRARVLEKNGFTRGNVPATARPGLTLSATPAVEQEGPRKPLAYNGAFVGGGQQARAEDALFRKRMEVLRADQASGQASRGDYISPFETNPNRRAELDAQQRKNVEDIAARQISEATVRMLNDQATGLTSDRNLSMMPYEQRRAVINDRRNLIALNADMQQKRMEEEGKAASRAAEMARAEMEDSTTRRGQDLEVDAQGKKLSSEERRAMAADSTTRRGQDIEQQTNLTNAEIQARSKALDREALLEAARIRKTVPVDRVKIEAIKGYNKFIGEQVALKPELQDDPAFLEKAMKMYGLSAADLSTPMMQGVTPENDDEFPTT